MQSAINLHHSCVIDTQEFIKSCDFGNTLRLALGFFLDNEIILAAAYKQLLLNQVTELVKASAEAYRRDNEPIERQLQS